MGDFDGDGWPDLSVTSTQGRISLLHNRQDGTFENRTELLGNLDAVTVTGMAWADVDNDGDLDLLGIGFVSGRNYLWINPGKQGGLFTEEAQERGAALEEGALRDQRGRGGF